jgi:L-asparaginase
MPGPTAASCEALVDSGVRGIVVACTGNGTLHRELEEALKRASTAGVAVWRSTRCGQGVVIDSGRDVLPSAAGLSPWQARVELMLSLMES